MSFDAEDYLRENESYQRLQTLQHRVVCWRACVVLYRACIVLLALAALIAFSNDKALIPMLLLSGASVPCYGLALLIEHHIITRLVV